jgi:Tfp pilus assembly protein FimV
MAAIAHPTPHPRQVQVRPALRLVRNVARPSDAVYRRRRLFAVVLLAGFALAVAGVAFALTSGETAPFSVRAGAASGALVEDPAAFGAGHTSPPAGSFYVVQPGDTLWSIACELAPAGDIRAEVDRLQDLNGSAALQAGQRLRLTAPPGS